MILALDIGNTNVVLGCIADGEILFTERMATDSGKTELDYAISLKMVLELREIKVSEITGAIIGSVVPPVTSLMREAIRKVTGQEALVVNVDMNIGLEVLMDNPSSVGTDLIVGAVAGINRYPVPLILIDMGTATTICVVNENKQYIGGMILPGIGVSMNSLTSRTAQLPPPESAPLPLPVHCIRPHVQTKSGSHNVPAHRSPAPPDLSAYPAPTAQSNGLQSPPPRQTKLLPSPEMLP